MPDDDLSFQRRRDAADVQRIGIVSAFGAEADLLIERATARREVFINGNRFVLGRLCGNDVVIVLCGVSLVNAAMVTQLMLERFRIERLVMSGIAGGVDPALDIGDVVVPDRWLQPMEVYWSNDDSVPAPCGTPGDLAPLGLKLAHGADGLPLKNFSVPAGGMFVRETFVRHERAAHGGEFRLDFPADPAMLAVARAIAPKLQRCAELDARPGIHPHPRLLVGGVGASGPAFLASPAYRSYLHDALHVQAMDMETAALAQVAYANSVPYVAFRSLSDVAGGDDSHHVGAFFGSGMAETNASEVTLSFLDAWAQRERQVAAAASGLLLAIDANVCQSNPTAK
jgi:adenosylhomocysteine nucleosidase